MIYSLGRKKGNPSAWHLEEHMLSVPTQEQARDWVASITASVDLNSDRWGPRREEPWHPRVRMHPVTQPLHLS